MIERATVVATLSSYSSSAMDLLRGLRPYEIMAMATVTMMMMVMMLMMLMVMMMMMVVMMMMMMMIIMMMMIMMLVPLAWWSRSAVRRTANPRENVYTYMLCINMCMLCVY